ncbi:MAG: radical SAM protein [Proteobacteria bacterium]|nr:radical SAM protein [Pseudomonadota bacterium]
MTHVLLIQLPVPQRNLGIRTGNVPLASALLKQAASDIKSVRIHIVPEPVASYLGDKALLEYILEQKPDIIGFSIFSWNIERSVWFSEIIKTVYTPRIIFGGPEITPDNPLLKNEAIDFRVFGEGEAVFINLLTDENLWDEKTGCASAETIFRESKSPYLSGLIDPSINQLIYVETQRGCPYKCGFCYYNKGRKNIIQVSIRNVMAALRWAKSNQVGELSFIDPSLNIRPDLEAFLIEAARINADNTLALSGEIRADHLDEKTADLYQRAGFTGFEIGLQSTNPDALSVMKRKTDLDGFLNGTALLKQRNILPRIDLIVGLPGDTCEGFKHSVDFIHENGLSMDVQVFPLSILPGTDFKKNSKKLGICFDPSPPYTTHHTKSFSEEDMMLAFDYAESVFDTSLFPSPDIHIPLYASGQFKKRAYKDVRISISGTDYLKTLFLYPGRSLKEIRKLSGQVTHPYQVIILDDVSDQAFISEALLVLSSENPFTPFEIIFVKPGFRPDINLLLNAVKLKRPHYLDTDLRFVYGQKGNRAVIFTVLSDEEDVWFTGEMKRQVFWWKKGRFPTKTLLDAFWEFDGILIDTPATKESYVKWQDEIVPHVDDLVELSFAMPDLQKRWMEMTCKETYFTELF